MKALLIDRLGFERIEPQAVGETFIVPRKFVPGQSEFRRFGSVMRGGEEFMEYREVDDMDEELKRQHSVNDYLRGEIRRLEGSVRYLEQENGAIALKMHRSSHATEKK